MDKKVEKIKQLNDMMIKNGEYASILITTIPRRVKDHITDRINVMKDVERLIREYNELEEQINMLYDDDYGDVDLDDLQDNMTMIVSKSEIIMDRIVDFRLKSVKVLN